MNMNTSTRGVETGTRLKQGRGWQTPVFLCSAAVVASFVFVVDGLDAPRLPVLAVAPLDAVLLRGLDESTSLVAWGAISLFVAAPLVVAATAARPHRR